MILRTFARLFHDCFITAEHPYAEKGQGFGGGGGRRAAEHIYKLSNSSLKVTPASLETGHLL